MRTYDAIRAIGQRVIDDGRCDAILLKGSIGRGDDDAYSDVDMYLVAAPGNTEAVWQRSREYLSAYKELVFLRDANFGLPQKIAIFVDALHVDLYVAEKGQIDHADPVKVWYDPKGLFRGYRHRREAVAEEAIAERFSNALYGFVEADAAYRRGNTAWAAYIMGHAAADIAVLLRYAYDKPYAFLGLKKINEIIPPEEYQLLADAYAFQGKGDFGRANARLMQALEVFLAQADAPLKEKLNLRLFTWVKESLGTLLFPGQGGTDR